MTALPDQPDGIDPASYDLPDPARAAERVRTYLEWFGDGLVDIARDDRHQDSPPAPLYARDLQVLADLATSPGPPPDLAPRITTVHLPGDPP